MSELKAFGSATDLFAASLEDLADLPAFETPPTGAYILQVSTEVKKVNEKDCVEASFSVVETVELEESTGTPVVAGTKFSQLFMLDNEFGVGNLKKFLAPFAAHYETNNIGELVETHVKDVQISASIKNRKDKTDPRRVYASVLNITVI